MSHAVPTPLPAVAEVKQHLLPLAPLQAALEWLIEILPRARIPLALQPQSDIEVKNEITGAYLSTGQCPKFSVATDAPLASGWYYFETALTRSSGSRHAELQFNFYQQPTQDLVSPACMPVSSNLRGSVREVIFIPDGVQTIDWVPTKARGFFTQTPILLHKISRLESGLRRWYRVLCDLWRFRRVPLIARPELTLQTALRDLQAAYKASTLLRLKRISGFDYQSYLVELEKHAKLAMPALRKKATLSCSVTISIVMVVDTRDHSLLRGFIESLKCQSYSRWELLLVGDYSLEFINQLYSLEPSLKIKQIPIVEKNLAEQLNEAITSAAGDYILRMPPTYMLAEDALLHLALETRENPQANVIYFDDDFINTKTGERTLPCFRPDWNPELLNSHHYVGECIAYSKTFLTKIGCYRQAHETAKDYDLILRSAQVCNVGEIRHIRRVMFHRQSQPSTSRPVNLCYHAAAKFTLQENLKSIDAVVADGADLGFYRIRYPLPETLPLVSIIVPTRDRVDLLEMCVTSVQSKTKYPNWEMIIVDNGSTEAETQAYFKYLQERDRRVKVLQHPGHFNYSAINNHAVQECSGEVLVLLNNDIEVIATDWLDELVSHAIRPGIGAVGAKLLYADGTVQHAGVLIGMGGVAGHVHRFIPSDAPGYCHRSVVAQNLSAVTGACLAVVKERFLKVNGLDENLKVAFNDIDLCLRLLEAGMRNVFTPWALLFHHESLTRGTNDTPAKKAIFDREFAYMKTRWSGQLSIDPAWGSYCDVVKFD